MKKINLVALDIGAGSGRAVLCTFDGQKIDQKEVYRFDNEQYLLNGTLYWDFLKIMDDVSASIAICGKNAEGGISSVAIDTWGADFGLIDRQGDLISNPVTYRDKRTDDIHRLVYTKIGKEELYRLNNSVTYDYCTLFQLYYLARFKKEILKITDKYLPIASLINYFLTSEKTVDPSILSGSQLFDIKGKAYLFDILERLRIPIQILPEVSEAGTVLGELKDCYHKVSTSNVKPKVILVCSHDSASASTGIPLSPGTKDQCYINSGTWSLVGMESDEALVSDKALSYGFTSWRAFRENIMTVKIFNGFYFIQQCKKIWDQREGIKEDYDDFYTILELSYLVSSLLDLDDKRLFDSRFNILENIIRYFRFTGQPELILKKDIVTSVLLSMVLEYRLSVKQLEELYGNSFNKVYMVGGGSKNKVFCQWLADCLGKVVFTGYPEATINGNIAAQLIATGELKDIGQARQAIRDSSKEKAYSPSGDKDKYWPELIEKYSRLKKNINNFDDGKE